MKKQLLLIATTLLCAHAGGTHATPQWVVSAKNTFVDYKKDYWPAAILAALTLASGAGTYAAQKAEVKLRKIRGVQPPLRRSFGLKLRKLLADYGYYLTGGLGAATLATGWWNTRTRGTRKAAEAAAKAAEAASEQRAIEQRTKESQEYLDKDSNNRALPIKFPWHSSNITQDILIKIADKQAAEKHKLPVGVLFAEVWVPTSCPTRQYNTVHFCKVGTPTVNLRKRQIAKDKGDQIIFSGSAIPYDQDVVGAILQRQHFIGLEDQIRLEKGINNLLVLQRPNTPPIYLVAGEVVNTATQKN